jgi:hypothetical protein
MDAQAGTNAMSILPDGILSSSNYSVGKNVGTRLRRSSAKYSADERPLAAWKRSPNRRQWSAVPDRSGGRQCHREIHARANRVSAGPGDGRLRWRDAGSAFSGNPPDLPSVQEFTTPCIKREKRRVRSSPSKYSYHCFSCTIVVGGFCCLGRGGFRVISL